MMIDPLLEILATMLREFTRLTKQVLVIVRDEPVCRRLMSTPGVGPMTALAFRATIDQPERFKKSRDVGAHLGLTPRRYQSGETDIQGRISRCGDELARTALYEAAHSLLIRSKKWSALRAWGMKIAKRRGMARARVAVARKLATILHACGSITPNSVLAANRRLTQPSRRSRWSRPEEANLKPSNNPRQRKESSPWGRWARRSR